MSLKAKEFMVKLREIFLAFWASDLFSHPSPTPMFLNNNIDPRDHSSCALTYDEAEHWLRATWRGYVDLTEAMHGAEAYLQHEVRTPSALLLNDNS